MTYPDGINALTIKTDHVDKYMAAHVNAIRTALLEVATELGDTVKGSTANLKTRLDAGLNNNGTIKTGFSISSATITTLSATTIGAKVIGNHNASDTSPLQRIMEDSGIPGGNARGNHALDLQSARTGASQVSSGDYSVLLGGKGNTCAGPYCTVAGGLNNALTSSGYYCSYNTIGGGSQITISGSYTGRNTICGGYQNTISGGYCNKNFIGGGSKNTMSAYSDYSTISGGYDNSISASNATIGGGTRNAATGFHSTIPGGEENTASGWYSSAFGHNSVASLFGQISQASGRFSANGDAQSSVVTLWKQTTDNSETALALDGSSALILLNEDVTYFFEAHVVARRTDADNESASYVIRWCCDRNTSGSAALVGAIDYTLTIEDTAAWACIVDVNGNNTRILVTGEVGKTIRWVARVSITEVHG